MKIIFSVLLFFSLNVLAQNPVQEKKVIDCQIANQPNNLLMGIERLEERGGGWFNPKKMVPRVTLYTYNLSNNNVVNLKQVYNNCADGATFSPSIDNGKYFLTDACSGNSAWLFLELSPILCNNGACPGQVDFGYVTESRHVTKITPISCKLTL